MVQESQMKLRSFPLLGLVSVITLATAACSGNKNTSANETATTAASESATPEATGTPAATSHAAQFLTDAIQADNAEIKFAKKAEDMGSTKAVKDFAKMIEDDHKKHRDDAKKIARDMKVPVPDSTTPEADSEYNMATSMSGAGFDKDFVADMVKDHKAAIDMFQKEADSSDPAQVTAFAKDSLPTLKKHLKAAESLQK